MKALRLTVPVALLMLLGVVRPAWSADTVLVPGDPALTQSTVDQERANLEWVLDLKMSEKMRTLHRSSLVADWKGWDRDARAGFLQGVGSWSKVERLTSLDNIWLRTQSRGGVLLWLCRKPDPGLYDGLLALDLASGGPPANPDRNRVLVPGTALTRGAVERVTELFEWLFDLELTKAQGAALRELLIDEARRGDKEALEGTLSLARIWGRVARLNVTDRRLVRAEFLPQYVADMTSPAGAGDKTNRWLLALYQSAYPALAAGEPPLTRWQTDAHAEMFCFHKNQVAGKEVWVADRAFKDSYAKRLAAAYEKGSAAQKEKLTRGLLQWETLRAAWPMWSDDERRQLRDKWAVAHKPVGIKPPAATTLDDARRQAEQAKLDAELERIRHETVMSIIGGINSGGRTEFNPRTNRYEWRSYP
jgi:hypothetical protein